MVTCPGSPDTSYRGGLPFREASTAGSPLQDGPHGPLAPTSREAEAGPEPCSKLKVEKCSQLRKYGPWISCFLKSGRRLPPFPSATEALSPAQKQSRGPLPWQSVFVGRAGSPEASSPCGQNTSRGRSSGGHLGQDLNCSQSPSLQHKGLNQTLPGKPRSCYTSSYTVTVNFMWQLGWATGYPDMQSNIIWDVSTRVLG